MTHERMFTAASLEPVPLDAEHAIFVGEAPPRLLPEPDGVAFEAWWELRPREPSIVKLYGRDTELPRWQRAYGHDYRFSGQTTPAHPVPEALKECLAWSTTLDERINGLLVNWYSADEGHYIGPHRDSPTGLAPGAPIITVSLGAPRTFRVRPYRGRGFVDVGLAHGTVVVIPWATNQRFTHEVPHFRRNWGRRISFTARAFTPSDG